MRKFLDLSQTVEFDPETHVPLFCRSVTFKPKKGTDNYLWTLTLVSEVKKGEEDEDLPMLPTPFNVDRAKAVEAMRGGVHVENKVKKFRREGTFSVMPFKGGEMDIDGQASALEPCVVHLGTFSASEGIARVLWKITVTADSSKAQEWVELMRSDVWLRFELSPGNPQLTLFGGRSNVVPLEGETRRRTRRGGAKHKQSRDEEEVTA